jgi:hypothetical protein
MNNITDEEIEQAASDHVKSMHPSWHKQVYKDFYIEGAKWAISKQSGGMNDNSLIYFMDWVVKNVWFDNDEYFIKRLGYTSFSLQEILDHFRFQNPNSLKSESSPQA